MKEVQTESGNNVGKSFFGIFIGILTWVVVAAIWYFNYPFPGGDASVSSFIIIFFRELVALGAVLVVMAFILFKKAFRSN